MLRRVLIGWLFTFIVLPGFSLSVFAQTDVDTKVMEKFKKAFPRIKSESIKKTDMEGIYEVDIPGKILYYFPGKDYLFAGSIWNSTGKNLTNERESEIITEKVRALSLENALKIGKGERTVIEFTSPDCPYCRDASKYLSKQKNITRYVFFVPFIHKDTEQKIKYIFCAKESETAYKEAMNGNLDGKKLAICNDEKAEALLNEHRRISRLIGINSTPQFWIGGKHVQGADIPLIESLLGAGADREPEKK